MQDIKHTQQLVKKGIKMKTINEDSETKANSRVISLKMLSLFTGFAILLSNCYGQQIELQGKDNQWRQVGTIEANTPFQIQASGTVDFGGIGNSDGVNAGVTGNAFVRGLRDIWPTIEQGLADLAKIFGSGSSSSTGDSSTGSAGDGSAGSTEVGSVASALHVKSVFRATFNKANTWTWVTFINNKASVNYDEGGFWVALTKDDQAPSDPNTICKPALYYWFKQLFDHNLNIAYHQKVVVWVRQHDGGRDPFKSMSDYGDNSGSYSIWLNTDLPSTGSMTIDGIGVNASALSVGGRAGAGKMKNLAAVKARPIMLISGKVYKLQNMDTKFFLHGDNMASGGNVREYQETAAPCQQWLATRNKDGTYSFKNMDSKNLLHGDNLASGGNVRQYKSLNAPCQKWLAIANYDGSYCFENEDSHQMLHGDNIASGGNVRQFQKADILSQKWVLKVK